MADIASVSGTIQILEKYSISPSKRYGQNFLIDKNIADKIIKAANIQKEDIILEIGPGIGSLTQQLARTGASIESIEIDKKLIEALKANLASYSNVTILKKDALHLNPEELPKIPNKLVANLPYNIASSLLINYLNDFESIQSYVVMVQKEVAQRILADCGSKDYGTITVKLNLMADIQTVARVSPNVFIPKPKVESTVLKLTRKKPQILTREDRIQFFKLVSAAFGERRKKVSNSLASSLKLERTYVESVLAEASIEPFKRAEQLCLEDYLRLYKALPTRRFL